MTSVDAYKLQVKIGAAEFSAEGPEKTVKEQFQMFLAAVTAIPAANPPVATKTNGTSDALSQPLEDDAIRRFFQDDGEDAVSLRALPKTENRDADTLVLLMYGHKLLKGQQDLVATKLLKTAKQSGVIVDRVERVMGIHEKLYTKGGIKKGTRYGLNNQGVAYAEELLKKML